MFLFLICHLQWTLLFIFHWPVSLEYCVFCITFVKVSVRYSRWLGQTNKIYGGKYQKMEPKVRFMWVYVHVEQGNRGPNTIFNSHWDYVLFLINLRKGWRSTQHYLYDAEKLHVLFKQNQRSFVLFLKDLF